MSGFDPSPHPLVAQQWSRYGAGMRTPSTEVVLETLVQAILEQRVTGLEARRSWGWLVATYGEPAPGPAPRADVRVPHRGCRLEAVPSWAWHQAGVDGSRSATILRAASYAGRLQQCADLSHVEAQGPDGGAAWGGKWTSAEVAARALGDADAVSFGDFHVAKNVVYAMTGEEDGTDERLAELLAPWPGHRGRVQRLVEMTGISRPAHGPRYSPQDFRGR